MASCRSKVRVAVRALVKRRERRRVRRRIDSRGVDPRLLQRAVYSGSLSRYVRAMRRGTEARPVRLGLPPMAATRAGNGPRAGEQPGLQLRVGDVVDQRPGQPRRLEPADRQPHRRRGCPQPPRNRRVDIPADFNLITSRTWRIASLSVGIRSPFAKPKGGTVSEPEEASSPRATSSRNGGRDHLGMVGEIKSERWARSFRNGGRHRAEPAASNSNRQVRTDIAGKYRWLQAQCALMRLAGNGRERRSSIATESDRERTSRACQQT